MSSVRSESDQSGRWLGLLVFLLGILFLVIVFTLAYRDLTGAGVIGQLTGSAPAVDAGEALRTLALKGVLLFLMAYVGSAVAGRGIGLYSASRAPHEQ
jgi:hypothetical protein